MFGWSRNLREGIVKDSTSKSDTYDWKTRERWEDYPVPDYDAKHTYCLVAIEDRDGTFYYRTRNPELEVGDMVYVPFGYKNVEIGKIISMKDYIGHFAPYPLSKTKYIISKVQEK